jgi:hypothetical protein
MNITENIEDTEVEEAGKNEVVPPETYVSPERKAALLAWHEAGQEVRNLERMKNNGMPVARATIAQAYAVHAALGDKLRTIR